MGNEGIFLNSRGKFQYTTTISLEDYLPQKVLFAFGIGFSCLPF
jgi:hypothetical protein